MTEPISAMLDFLNRGVSGELIPFVTGYNLPVGGVGEGAKSAVVVAGDFGGERPVMVLEEAEQRGRINLFLFPESEGELIIRCPRIHDARGEKVRGG